VGVTSATGQNPSAFFGVEREGIARRGSSTGTSGPASVERIFGYDSDSSDDWTEQPVHSLGLENLSSGLRTPGTPTGDRVLITEINVNNGMLELFNDGSFPVDLQNFFFLTSRRQGSPLTLATPFSSQTIVAPGQFAVVGSGTTRPQFVSPSAVFVGLTGTGQFLDFTSLESVVVLYTDRGTLLDMVRATGTGSEVLHSDPRPPAPPRSFLGGVSRPLVSDISRIGTVTDTNSGEDWINVPDMTLGTSNGTFGLRGFGAAIDVRFHDSGTGKGLALLINGTPSLAGMSYQILFSATHSDGRGPILGMGLDVLSNFQVTQGVFPFAGTLDGRGAARADLPSGSLPQGIGLDCVFLLLDGSDFVDRTRVLRFDT
jgi:hypothetical protein